MITWCSAGLADSSYHIHVFDFQILARYNCRSTGRTSPRPNATSLSGGSYAVAVQSGRAIGDGWPLTRPRNIVMSASRDRERTSAVSLKSTGSADVRMGTVKRPNPSGHADVGAGSIT